MASGGRRNLLDMDLNAFERRMVAQAPTDLPVLPLARHTTDLLARILIATPMEPEPQNAPASYYQRLATTFLSVLALRTARACILVTEAGYLPEAHGLKRRLSEAYHRAEAIASDESGEHARQWLAGEISRQGALFATFGSSDLWSVYGWGAHADVASVHSFLTVAMPTEDDPDRKALALSPSHDATLSNALLVEIAREVRDFYAVMSVVREMKAGTEPRWRAVLGELDVQIDAMVARYYVLPPS